MHVLLTISFKVKVLLSNEYFSLSDCVRSSHIIFILSSFICHSFIQKNFSTSANGYILVSRIFFSLKHRCIIDLLFLYSVLFIHVIIYQSIIYQSPTIIKPIYQTITFQYFLKSNRNYSLRLTYFSFKPKYIVEAYTFSVP